MKDNAAATTAGASPLAVDLLQAAQLLNVCVKTLRREICRGKLNALRIGRVWRVRVSELNSYLTRLEEPPKSSRAISLLLLIWCACACAMFFGNPGSRKATLMKAKRIRSGKTDRVGWRYRYTSPLTKLRTYKTIWMSERREADKAFQSFLD